MDLTCFEVLSCFFRLWVRLRGFRGLGQVLGGIIDGELDENVVLVEVVDEDREKLTLD